MTTNSLASDFASTLLSLLTVEERLMLKTMLTMLEDEEATGAMTLILTNLNNGPTAGPIRA